MKKIMMIIGILTAWASPLPAQQAAGVTAQVREYQFGGGWYGVLEQSGNSIAGEYEFLRSSGTGELKIEWDPLPYRFVLDTYYLNTNDYFGEMDYSFGDIVVLNAYSRGLFHNLHHYTFGPDDPSTSLPSFTDLNADDLYGIHNRLSRGFVRLKTPDFPLHLYADVKAIEREGSMQQRFLSSNLNKISQSRNIDWDTSEYRAGVNSHLGPLEVDYSHAERKFEARGDQVLFDPSWGFANPHNLVPDLESASDTLKVHTNYSGKVVLSGTYTAGDRSNTDSETKADFVNSAGDIMIMPVTSLIFTLKYRHYDLEETNPDAVNRVTISGLQSVNVRNAISSTRDTVSGVLRYRATDRLTIRGEYIGDTTDRYVGTGTLLAVTTGPTGTVTGPASWDVPWSTTKNTAKAGLAYRVMNKMIFRADYSSITVDNPAHGTDPDDATHAQASITWMPTPRINTVVSFGMVREERDNLSAPLGGGSREASRDQGLASVTMMIGNLSSVTASYAYYRNGVKQTVTLREDTGAFALEPAVPYEDISHVGSLALTFAPGEAVNLFASGTRSYSRGSFTLAGAGSVTDVSGIAELSDLKVVDTVYTAGIETEHTRYLSSEARVEYRSYDDQIDDMQDGRVKLLLASLFLKW